MTKRCPNCKIKQNVNVLQETKAEESLDNLGHLHLECKVCGWQFNHWTVDRKIVKKIFGDSYSLYQ